MASFEDYQTSSLAGRGTYCTVYQAVHRASNERVAVKAYNIDGQTAYLAMGQLHILRELHHRNTAQLKGVFAKDEKLYLIENYMDMDLRRFLTFGREHNRMLNKAYAYQLLDALRYLHSKRIVHCSIHPENILIDREGRLVVSDFIAALYEGSAGRIIIPSWYCPPEALGLRDVEIHTSLDLWSAGCIIAEMATRTPLFMSDTDEGIREQINSLLGPNANRSLSDVVGEEDANLLDLVYKLLRVNPDERISAAEALEHPYFDDVPFAIVEESNTPESTTRMF